ncbi:hypothetical protein LUZ60_008967 [Juncus effusus]|nr:hypothetical protein LUZ60_008967 [Juncus effusus]
MCCYNIFLGPSVDQKLLFGPTRSHHHKRCKRIDIEIPNQSTFYSFTNPSQIPTPLPPLTMATLASQRPIEVRCAGCSETLEVEPGLTEFICPDCHTPQALPPELMPRKRKALPLKMQLPCGSCAALLNVPHGLARFSCPRCGVELAVDQERLKGYLAGSSVEAGDVAFVMPSAVRLPLGVDAELPTQVNIAHQPLRATIYSQAANIEQNYVITPRAPRAASIDLGHQDLAPVSSRGLVSSSVNTNNDSAPISSRGLVSSSINTNNNIHTTIPASVTPVPCRLNSQQLQTEQELEEEEREERVRTPPPTKKAVSKGNPKQNKKHSAGPTTKELGLSLRRSKRLSKSSPPTKKKQKSQQSQSQPSQSQPSQSSQPNEDNNETPLDIARHYNDLLPLDNDPLWNPVSPIPNPVSPIPNLGSQIPDPNPPILDPGSQTPDLNPQGGDMNSEDDEEGDEAYVPESDSSQSEAELDSSRELEPDSVLQKALKDAQKRRGLTPGKSRKSKKSTPGKRGPSKCLEIWERPDDDPVEIEFNNVGQPVGEMAYALSNFLGSVARDGQLVPINYTGWKHVPAKNKDIVWYIVKSKFRMQEDNRRYVMQKVARIWINWKSRLKNIHYDVHDNDEARLADIDRRIEADQWPFLVEFWGSDQGKKRSEINKAARAKQKTYHTMGRKSFARIREEERLKRADKEEPCRAEMFILTHTRKDGTPVDEESARIIARLREELAKASTSPSSSKTLKNDILAKVLGKEKRITTYGLLPTRPDNWSPPPDPEERARIVREAKKLADEQAKPMKEQMEAMERRHKEMEMEMQVMRQAMLAMSGMVPPGFGGSVQGGDGERAVSDRDGSSSR